MSDTPVALDTSNPVSLLTTLLGSRMSERSRKALTAYVFGAAAYGFGKKAWNKYQNANTYVVSITEADEIYPEVQAWLLDLIPDDSRRSLSARSARRNSRNGDGYRSTAIDEIGGEAKKPKPPPLYLSYDGSMIQTVVIGGQKITVSVTSPDHPGGGDDKTYYLRRSDEKIQFTARSLAGREAVVDFLGKIAEAQRSQERTPNFYLSRTWGDWHRRDDLPRRDPSTVILPSGQMDRLIDDLQTFRDSEAAYHRLGVPYHRGYLLHGPPGSGKTSIARAIATHFAMDVYYMTLSDLDKDSGLLQMVSVVSAGSMLLLEDIDVLHATRDRDQDADSGDEKGRVSLSGLLNALDGLASPHGLVTFMTTNHLDRLDPALIRPGRVDMSEHIGGLTDSQLAGLYEMASGYPHHESFFPIVGNSALTTSDVVGILKRNLNNTEKAFEELQLLVQADWDRQCP